MSDLISRSELIMCLSDYALQESPNDNESTGEQRISKMIYDAIQNCISCVEEQPTAYSVDEVVEELERFPLGNLGCQELNEIIEIIKQGYVEKCEAKQGKWIFDKFTAKYGNPYRCSCCSEEFGDTYNYCPNCGASMKEVE